MKKSVVLKSILSAAFLAFSLLVSLPSVIAADDSVPAATATPPDASQKNGYNFAFANTKTYDGTPYIEITDIIFADALVTDDVSATGIGTLSSSDAGTYSIVNIDNIVLKGADKDKYEGLLPTSMKYVPINVTVEKAVPIFSFSTDAPDGMEYYSFAKITFTIVNDFDRPEGLPDTIQISREHDYVPGRVTHETARRSGSQYSISYYAPVPWSGLYGEIPFWADVLDDATNYQPATSGEYMLLILPPPADYYWGGDQEVFFHIAAAGDLYYTAESLQPFLDIWYSIDWDLDITQQHIVDAWYDQLLEAYYNLVPKPGDYSEIEKYLEMIPEDLSLYTDESVKALEKIKESIPWDLPPEDQYIINQYADDLYEAIQQLKYKPADYSALNELLKKVPGDLSLYTEESVKALENVKSSIDWELLIIDQKTVDEYTVKLQEALSNLKFKPADYTKVKAALNKIPSDLSIYTDESVKFLEEAKAAINWDKLINEQSVVDGYAQAIETAIQNLKTKQIQPPQPEAFNPNQPAPKGKASAETGDPTSIALWLLLFSNSALVTGGTLKRHRSSSDIK